MKRDESSNKNSNKYKTITLLIGVIMLTTMCGTMLNSCVKAPETEIYFVVPEQNSLMESYIIKTKEGRLIVIDGGIAGQGYEADPYIPAALRAVDGIKEGEPLVVEAWFLSHAHNDHFGELGKTLRLLAKEDNLTINNFYFDFPPYDTEEFPYKDGDYPDLLKLKKGFDHYAAVKGIEVPEGKSYYDVLNGAFINKDTIAAGQEIVIDELTFEIMQTWDQSDGSNVNNSSLVFRLHVGDKTIMFLHDLGINGGKRLLAKYGDGLKSDYVHMAHHGQNGVTEEVYQAIDADVYLWGTPIWVWTNTTNYRIGETRMWVNNGVDYDTADEHNIVTCLYPAFPSDPTSIEAWKKVLPVMRIKLD